MIERKVLAGITSGQTYVSTSLGLHDETCRDSHLHAMICTAWHVSHVSTCKYTVSVCECDAVQNIIHNHTTMYVLHTTVYTSYLLPFIRLTYYHVCLLTSLPPSSFEKKKYLDNLHQLCARFICMYHTWSHVTLL